MNIYPSIEAEKAGRRSVKRTQKESFIRFRWLANREQRIHG